MRRSWISTLAGAAAIAVFAAGCGGGVQSVQPRRTVPAVTGGQSYSAAVAGAQVRPADEVQVLEANYYGRRALKMTNGLVTVVAVPELGGRIMEYKIGSKPLLWVNQAELQRSEATPVGASGKRVWRNWGGYKVWPAPQERWGGPPDPEGSRLDGGAWVGRIVKPRGEEGQIELISPADTAVTGLQITRRVTMYKGTTRIRVQETFKNVVGREIRWSIWDVTQVPGSLSAGERFSEEARIYFPLNPSSRFTAGYRSLIQGPLDQWRTAGGVMEVSYKGQLGKIGADSTGGWIAYVDDQHDWALVKRFRVEDEAEYPDGGCTVEVFTSNKLPYMEMEVLSPLHKIAPGGRVSFTEDWYAARVGGPITDVGNAAAINEPVKVQAAGDKVIVTGKLGVFRPGKLRIVPLDSKGNPVAEAVEKNVGPTEIVALKEKMRADAAKVASVRVDLEAEGTSFSLASLAVAQEAEGR